MQQQLIVVARSAGAGRQQPQLLQQAFSRAWQPDWCSGHLNVRCDYESSASLHSNLATTPCAVSPAQLWHGQWLSPAMADALSQIANQRHTMPSGSTSQPTMPPSVAARQSAASAAAHASLDSRLFAQLMQLVQGTTQHQGQSQPAASMQSIITGPMQSPQVSTPAMEAPAMPSAPVDSILPETDGPSQPALQCSRGNTYQPSRRKRVNKHGLEKRLDTVLGRLTLLNRIKKGRWRLTVDQVVGRVVPGTPKLR